MKENEKDWDNPVFARIYSALACSGGIGNRQDAVTAWLNKNGFCNLTVCPVCKVDDFVHVESCSLGAEIRRIRKLLYVVA